MKGFSLSLALMALSPITLANSSGQMIYEQACITCHAPQYAKAMKAPAAFDTKAWKSRLNQAQLASQKDPKKYPSTNDYLLAQVKIGKGLMHHGGLCKESMVDTSSCSDANLTAAIEYMAKSPQ